MELVRYIFTLPGVRYFLSERICQYPLEKFFGCQRQRGRVNENPSVAEFVKNTQALRVCGNLPTEIKGNCRGSNSKRVLTFDKEHLSLREEESIKHVNKYKFNINIGIDLYHTSHVYNNKPYICSIYCLLLSLLRRLFDFCNFFLSSCLYISNHDLVKEKPRTVTYKRTVCCKTSFLSSSRSSVTQSI